MNSISLGSEKKPAISSPPRTLDACLYFHETVINTVVRLTGNVGQVRLSGQPFDQPRHVLVQFFLRSPRVVFLDEFQLRLGRRLQKHFVETDRADGRCRILLCAPGRRVTHAFNGESTLSCRRCCFVSDDI